VPAGNSADEPAQTKGSRALGKCWLWYPGLEEQDNIVEFVEEASSPSDRAVAQAHRAISLLREYRTRLIADVVTGKLDVREPAARLPEEVDGPEPLDEAGALSDAADATADDLDTEPQEAEI